MDINILQYTQDWKDLIYLAGRGCYGLEHLSFETLKKKEFFIKKLIENGHESVLEHCYISIQIIGCSRSFMAQLTRHRLAAYSIKSQHFLNHSDFKYKELEFDNEEVQVLYQDVMEIIRIYYEKFVNHYKVPVYIAREILPNACLTNIVMTANLREWRYIIKLRYSEDNTPEMQFFANNILEQFRIIFPEVFFDL